MIRPMDDRSHYHEPDEEPLEEALRLLRRIEERTRHMITQEQLDTDLAAVTTAIDTLATEEQAFDVAFQAWLAAHPAADFTAEDQALVDAASKLQAASTDVASNLAAVTPAPAP